MRHVNLKSKDVTLTVTIPLDHSYLSAITVDGKEPEFEYHTKGFLTEKGQELYDVTFKVVPGKDVGLFTSLPKEWHWTYAKRRGKSLGECLGVSDGITFRVPQAAHGGSYFKMFYSDSSINILQDLSLGWFKDVKVIKKHA